MYGDQFFMLAAAAHLSMNESASSRNLIYLNEHEKFCSLSLAFERVFVFLFA